MIKHIVMWKFKDGVADADKQEVRRQLEALTELVPEAIEIEVGLDILRSDQSFDLALNSKFASMDDLKTYAAHPEHVKVGAFLKTLVSERVACDYEV